MNNGTEKAIEGLICWRWALLALAAVLALAAYAPSRRVAFDRSIERMFADDDPLLAPYRKVKRVFGGNEIVLVVFRDEELLHPHGEGIRRLMQISQQLEAVAGVKGVLSLDRFMDERIVNPESVLATGYRDLFQNLTHSASGDLAAVMCMLTPEDEAQVSRRQTIDQLRAIALKLPSGMIAGEPVMVSDGFHYVQEDGRRLGIWSTVLMAVVIVAFFRSVRWVLIPVLVVQLALLLTRAALAVSGLQISMVSSMLTAVVTVVGVATVVHVIVRYREERGWGHAPRESLLRAGVILAAPVIWSFATDAAGFGSLALARVGPVQDFGLMMALGALMVMIACPLVIPALALAGRRNAPPARVWGEGAFGQQLRAMARVAERHPYALGVPLVGLALVASAGAVRLEVETDFTRNFRAGSPIVTSYEFIETNLGGAGVWDVIVPAEETLSWSYLQRILRLEKRLREEVVITTPDGEQRPALTKVISLADIVNTAGSASPVSLDKMPNFLRKRLIAGSLGAMRNKAPEFFGALYGGDPEAQDQRYVRIMLRAAERQPAEQKRQVIAQVERIAQEEFPDAEVTGFFVLLTHLIDSLIQDQWWTFAMATTAIFVMMILVFRSVGLAVVSLVPNVLPIFMVMGVMGWLADFGFKINMGAAMIAAVSIGLSIDSSIHYVLSFRRARDAGKTVVEALEVTQHDVGLATIFATLALVCGFGVLATSEFVPTVYFGVLVGLTMLGGLFGNLVVLPVLLRLVAREGTPDEARRA